MTFASSNRLIHNRLLQVTVAIVTLLLRAIRITGSLLQQTTVIVGVKGFETSMKMLKSSLFNVSFLWKGINCVVLISWN